MHTRWGLSPLTSLGGGESREVTLAPLLDAALFESGRHLRTLGEVMHRARGDEVLHRGSTTTRVRVEVIAVLGTVLATPEPLGEFATTPSAGVTLILLRLVEHALGSLCTPLALGASNRENGAGYEDEDGNANYPVSEFGAEVGRGRPDGRLVDEELEDGSTGVGGICGGECVHTWILVGVFT